MEIDIIAYHIISPAQRRKNTRHTGVSAAVAIIETHLDCKGFGTDKKRISIPPSEWPFGLLTDDQFGELKDIYNQAGWYLYYESYRLYLEPTGADTSYNPSTRHFEAEPALAA